MMIITQFEGKQKIFHHYWLPLIYKHNECQFCVEDTTRKFAYPKDIKNLQVVTDLNKVKLKGPVLYCPMNKLPTYKAMINLQQMAPGEYKVKDVHAKFYEV